MKRTILLKYGEIILKGANRRAFEKQLADSIRRRLKGLIGEYELEYMQSTVYVTPERDEDVEIAHDALSRIFGIVSLCIAYRAEKSMEEIMRVALEYIPPHLEGYRSFKADARRSDKTFPYTTPQIMMEVGGELSEKCPDIAVDVINPEITVMIEVREKYAFIHAGKTMGAGGLPYGTGGRGLLLLSGGIDSPVAGWMMAKRGVEVDALHFESFPYTSERALEKVKTLAGKLCRYTDKMHFNKVSLTEIQEAIRDNCEYDYFTLILRRFMMEIADEVARRVNANALITGESIGQVASQTMQALAVTDCVPTIPVFRPLIGMDKEEIVQIARRIDTFATSIEPYEDCCTVFTPPHPRTRPVLEKVIRAEEGLDRKALIENALKTLEHQVIYNEAF
ncbi:MAG: tRNA 4-thiouridine(8) synthase ThiI [Clostridia bacterium]|nr:tRNA 4-thiouridine(8) synthase ThiI [Clostridia bacterium]